MYRPKPNTELERIHNLRKRHPLIGNFWRTQKTAVVFDFDKTISPFYMQRVIFEHLGIPEKDFWDSCNTSGKAYASATGMPQNYEHSYLNLLIECLHKSGITPEELFSLGENIVLYPGITEIILDIIEKGSEVYIITSGIRELALNSSLVKRVHEKYPGYFDRRLFGCSLTFEEGKYKIEDVVSSHQKPNIIEWISKGCDVLQTEYNPPLHEDDVRIALESIIYVGDGPTDIPAFNLIRNHGGYTIGVYNPKEPAQFDQLVKIDADGRLNLVAKADYNPLPSDDKVRCKYSNLSLYGKLMSALELNLERVEHINSLFKDITPEEIEAFKAILAEERSITFVHAWTK